MRIPSLRCVPGPQIITLQTWFLDAWRQVRPLFPWATTAQNSRNANAVNLGSPYRDTTRASSPASTFTKRLKGSRPARILLVLTRWMRLVLQKKVEGLERHSPRPLSLWYVLAKSGEQLSAAAILLPPTVKLLLAEWTSCQYRDFRPSLLAIGYRALSPMQTCVPLESYWSLLLWSKRTWPESRSPKLY